MELEPIFLKNNEFKKSDWSRNIFDKQATQVFN